MDAIDDMIADRLIDLYEDYKDFWIKLGSDEKEASVFSQEMMNLS